MQFPTLAIGDLVSRIPIIQGGMGVNISLSGLASAVANEGGIGVIACAMPGIHEPDIKTNSVQANLRVLTAPVPRSHLIYGKILAAATFMALALALVMVSLLVSIQRVPLEELGMSANLGPRVALAVFGGTLPFVAVGAALLTVIASFTRTYKEAQTWLSAVLLVPTLPIAVAGLLDVKANAVLMAVPSLSQHLLIQGLLRNEPLPGLYVAISVASTLALGALLTALAGRLYGREQILG